MIFFNINILYIDEPVVIHFEESFLYSLFSHLRRLHHLLMNSVASTKFLSETRFGFNRV